MKDTRKEKIRNLKNQITLEKSALTEILAEAPILTDTTEQTKEKIAKRKTEIATKRAIISNLEEELNLVRMNRLSSSFFEFTPTPPNRRQRRAMRKLNRI